MRYGIKQVLSTITAVAALVAIMTACSSVEQPVPPEHNLAGGPNEKIRSMLDY